MAGTSPLEGLPLELHERIADCVMHGAFGDDGQNVTSDAAQQNRRDLTSLRSASRTMQAVILRKWQRYLFVDLTRPSTLRFFDEALRDPGLASRVRAVQVSTLTGALPVGTREEWGWALGQDDELEHNPKKLTAWAQALSAPDAPSAALGMHQGVASTASYQPIRPWQTRIEALILLAFRYLPNLATLRIAYEGAVQDSLYERILAERPQPCLQTLHFHAGPNRAWAVIHPIQFLAFWQLPNLKCIWFDQVAFIDNLSFHPAEKSPIIELRARYKGVSEHICAAIGYSCPHLTKIILMAEDQTFFPWHEVIKNVHRRRETLEELSITTTEPWPTDWNTLDEAHHNAPTKATWAKHCRKLTHLQISVAAIDPRFAGRPWPALLPASLISLRVFCPGPQWVDATRSLAISDEELPALQAVQIIAREVDIGAYRALEDAFPPQITFEVVEA